MTLTEQQKDKLLKAIATLYSLSCRSDSKMEERRLEKLAESLSQVVDDYSEGDKEE